MSNELMSTSVIVGVEGTLIYSYIHFIGTYRICRVWLEQQLAAGDFNLPCSVVKNTHKSNKWFCSCGRW